MAVQNTIQATITNDEASVDSGRCAQKIVIARQDRDDPGLFPAHDHDQAARACHHVCAAH